MDLITATVLFFYTFNQWSLQNILTLCCSSNTNTENERPAWIYSDNTSKL